MLERDIVLQKYWKEL